MTRVISISDEAYDKLRRIKNEKSFSKVIVELVAEKGDTLMQFVGALSTHEADTIKKEIYRDRKVPSRRFK
jgi:predicted CopG family antitoxin